MDCGAKVARNTVQKVQYFRVANDLTLAPGSKTRSLLYDTEFRMSWLSRLVPVIPTVALGHPDEPLRCATSS